MKNSCKQFNISKLDLEKDAPFESKLKRIFGENVVLAYNGSRV